MKSQAMAMNPGFWSFQVRPEFSERMLLSVKVFLWAYLAAGALSMAMGMVK